MSVSSIGKKKLHQMFSSSSTTRVISLYDCLKVCKLMTQSMRDYLTGIKSTCDDIASCGHPIDEMQPISITLNGVKGTFGSIVCVIHASRNSYDLTSVNIVRDQLLDVETHM